MVSSLFRVTGGGHRTRLMGSFDRILLRCALPENLLSVIDWTLRLPRPLILGINGAQGAGKTTLAAALVAAAEAQGLAAFHCSIDDFYLRRAEQCALAGHRLLEHRGYPGTHDIALGLQVLQSLSAGRPTRVPVYDKSAFQGRGDRMPEAQWRPVQGPLDILIFEGWMLGFRPAESVEPELELPNRLLAAYAPWWAFLDAMILMEAPDFSQIVQWRVDAERARRARGGDGLSDAEALDYISRFEPAYRAWVPGLYAHPPRRHHLRLRLPPGRLPRG